MQGTRTPLSTWFWGAYLVTTQTPGQSALQFQRQLDLDRYETAFQILHKLRSGMVRPGRDKLGGEYPVEVDETLVGGRTRGEGRGVHHKALVVGVVEVRTRKPKENTTKIGKAKRWRRLTYAGRLRLAVVPDRKAPSLESFVGQNVAKSSVVRTDGWQGYDGLPGLGFKHDPMVIAGDQSRTEKHLPTIHLVFSNLKTWIDGTHHGVSQQHLPAYLNEYVFRFNRRFYPMTAFNSVLGLAAHTVSPTYDQLYSGSRGNPAA